MLGLIGVDEVLNLHRLGAATLMQFLRAVTSTLTAPGMALKPVRQFSDWFNSFTHRLFEGAKSVVTRFFIGTGLSLVIVWVAVLLYACFYHFYVPTASLVQPAHFQFRVCPKGVGMCSFPTANVTLCAPSCAEVLGRGQQYRVILELQVPDSAPNRDVGMFMVQATMYDQHGTSVQQSSRAVSVKYQSDVLKLIQTFVLFPLYVTAFAEETQILSIELFEDFWDDYYQPAVGAVLEIHSRYLTFYSAQLQFHASYAGLKYYLFYYPLSSGVCGVAFNCLWLTALFLLSWYRLGEGLLEGWLTGTDVSSECLHTSEESEMDGGGCQGEREERVKNYIQPFTISTSAKASESAENIGSSMLNQPVAGTDQHMTPSKENCSHIQPFTISVASSRQRGKGQDHTEIKKVMAADADAGDDGKCRQRMNVLNS